MFRNLYSLIYGLKFIWSGGGLTSTGRPEEDDLRIWWFKTLMPCTNPSTRVLNGLELKATLQHFIIQT